MFRSALIKGDQALPRDYCRVTTSIYVLGLGVVKFALNSRQKSRFQQWHCQTRSCTLCSICLSGPRPVTCPSDLATGGRVSPGSSTPLAAAVAHWRATSPPAVFFLLFRPLRNS